MSVVVADNSPIDVLVRLGYQEVLPNLFGRVVIPIQVQAELLSPHTPEITHKFIVSPPEWLDISEPRSIEAIPRLHAGEEAAIALALELQAELLIIDDARGRQEAKKRGLAITGVIGVLEAAARRELLGLADAFRRIQTETDFRIRPELLAARLKEFHNWRKEQLDGG